MNTDRYPSGELADLLDDLTITGPIRGAGFRFS